MSPPDSERPGIYGEATFRAVSEGIARLIKEGQPGPYALILESSIFGDAHAPLPTTLITAGDRIKELVTGGFYGTGTLPANTGLLVSLGGQPTTIYFGPDTTTKYTGLDNQEGNYLFLVFEQVQLVARDPRAFVKLAFT